MTVDIDQNELDREAQRLLKSGDWERIMTEIKANREARELKKIEHEVDLNIVSLLLTVCFALLILVILIEGP